MKAIRDLLSFIILLVCATVDSYSQTVTQEWIVLPKPQGVNAIDITENQLYVDDSLNVYAGGIFSDTNTFYNSWGIAKINPSGSVIYYAIESGPGISDGSLKSIAVDSGLNVYASGDLLWSNGGIRAQTNKYNQSGVLEWSRQLDTVGGLGTVSLGNLISKDNFCYEHIKQGNITIRKYDAAGNVIQQFTNDTISFWLNNAFIASEFKRDSENNLFVSGTYADTTNQFDTKYFLKKFNSIGALLWESFYNPTMGYDAPTGLFIDGLQNVYLTGKADNGSGYETVVYDSSGNEKWHQLFQSYGVGKADEVVADNAGNCYVNGVAPDSVHNKGVLLKYDTAGNVIWQRAIDSVYGYSFAKVKLDAMANVYVTYSGSHNFLPYSFVVTAKYDSAGNLIWKVYSYLPKIVKALTLDKFNNVYIAGDGFIIKYSQTTGNEELTNSFEIINIYPNPVIDNQINFNLQFNNVHVSLYDCYGRLVYHIDNFNGSSVAIPDNIKSGIYVLEIVNEKILFNKKIIIH